MPLAPTGGVTRPSSRPGSIGALDPDDIRLSRVRALRGPNMYHLGPLITCEVNSGGYTRFAPDETARLGGHLSAVFPSLLAAGGDHSVPRLLGLTALELQRRAGSNVDFLDVRETIEPDWTRVSISYEDEEVGRGAANDALDVIRAAAAGTAIDVESLISELADLYRRRSLGPGARSMVAQAKRRGIPVRRFEDEDTIQLGLGRHLRRIDARLASHGGETLDELFPPGTPFTIPVLAVTGTNGKTTTTRLIAHLFRQAGHAVGYTTTDGTYLGDRIVNDGDNTGPFSANIVLSASEIDLAVLEVARGGIIRAGLGFEACDVGVVLNVTSDHLGIDDIETIEQLAEVKGVIPAVVKKSGYAVLNADDPFCVAMASRTPGTVVWFTTQSPAANAMLAEHLERGGAVAGISDDRFVIQRGSSRSDIASVLEVPLTMDGTARFQYVNVLAATAAAFAQGVAPEVIRNGLLSFIPSGSLMPGRLNMISTARGRVLVDYAHNAAAITGLMDFVHRLEARQRIGVIGAPGDRRDEDLRELGRLCGSLDHVFVKEVAKYRRGRPPGDTSRLIAEGLVRGGLAAEHIEIVDDEPGAVARALHLMQKGDLVIILADDHEKVREQLRLQIAGE